MISSHSFLNFESCFAEVITADLGNFQIVVPTVAQAMHHSCGATQASFPKREYSREGWVIYRSQVVSRLFELEIGSVALEGCPFKPVKRLGLAVPVSFETRSYNLLPPQVVRSALFSCQFGGKAAPYCSVFRNLSPRFVRIYPVQRLQRRQILSKVKQLLMEEAQFVAQNREQLKQIPFYRDSFGLADP